MALANKVELSLYGTSACHLCELAEALLAQILLSYPDWQIELLDIADDDALVERYGIRIPVLRNMITGAELDWPFTSEDVVSFVTEGAAK